ncbi:MAG: GNAT family N-acetyltransferase [Planctomycetes bacterium]|nr:GNAT family N-acetyltransferase [Planctomycetota bacterium]
MQPAGPAYSIRTPRLHVRCFDPRDAPALKQAIDASLEHLLPWLPWAREEPQSVEAKAEVLRRFRARFDLDKDWNYGIFDAAQTELVGGLGLHLRSGREARELGYWIAKAHAGQGLGSEAVAAIVRVGFEVEHLERMEIHCDEDNARSAALARKLGFHHDGTLRDRSERGDGSRGSRMVWSLLASEYESSPAARSECEAFDALGRKLLSRPAPAGARSRSAFR